MGRFITSLHVELIAESDPARWRLLKPLVYEADAGCLVVAPSDFETDFASVPRLPLAYLLTGDTAHRAAVLHDWLYSRGEYSRASADALLREASAAAGVPWWRRWLMWAAVRLGGAGAYQERAA